MQVLGQPAREGIGPGKGRNHCSYKGLAEFPTVERGQTFSTRRGFRYSIVYDVLQIVFLKYSISTYGGTTGLIRQRCRYQKPRMTVKAPINHVFCKGTGFWYPGSPVA